MEISVVRRVIGSTLAVKVANIEEAVEWPENISSYGKKVKKWDSMEIVIYIDCKSLEATLK